MQEKESSESERMGFPEGPATGRQPGGADWRFIAEVVAAVGSPLVGPLSLWLHPPTSDVGELFAFLAWPLLYFLAGLFASYFDQPHCREDGPDKVLFRMKFTAHNLRVAWLFFLLVFEGLAAMWILSKYQLALLPFASVTYAGYILLVVLWLVYGKRIREHQNHSGSEMADSQV